MTRHKTASCTVLTMAVLLIGATANATARDRHRVASATRIACGITGCFEVKPGCYAEMRPSGRGGVVAVVICNKR